MRLSVRMLRACDGHILMDIKSFFRQMSSNIPPLGVSGPKNVIFPKPEVSHKKVKIEVFALDIAFKLD